MQNPLETTDIFLSTFHFQGGAGCNFFGVFCKVDWIGSPPQSAPNQTSLKYDPKTLRGVWESGVCHSCFFLRAFGLQDAKDFLCLTNQEHQQHQQQYWKNSGKSLGMCKPGQPYQYLHHHKHEYLVRIYFINNSRVDYLSGTIFF